MAKLTKQEKQNIKERETVVLNLGDVDNYVAVYANGKHSPSNSRAVNYIATPKWRAKKWDGFLDKSDYQERLNKLQKYYKLKSKDFNEISTMAPAPENIGDEYIMFVGMVYTDLNKEAYYVYTNKGELKKAFDVEKNEYGKIIKSSKGYVLMDRENNISQTYDEIDQLLAAKNLFYALPKLDNLPDTIINMNQPDALSMANRDASKKHVWFNETLDNKDKTCFITKILDDNHENVLTLIDSNLQEIANYYTISSISNNTLLALDKNGAGRIIDFSGKKISPEFVKYMQVKYNCQNGDQKDSPSQLLLSLNKNGTTLAFFNPQPTAKKDLNSVRYYNATFLKDQKVVLGEVKIKGENTFVVANAAEPNKVRKIDPRVGKLFAAFASGENLIRKKYKAIYAKLEDSKVDIAKSLSAINACLNQTAQLEGTAIADLNNKENLCNMFVKKLKRMAAGRVRSCKLQQNKLNGQLENVYTNQNELNAELERVRTELETRLAEEERASQKEQEVLEAKEIAILADMENTENSKQAVEEYQNYLKTFSTNNTSQSQQDDAIELEK